MNIYDFDGTIYNGDSSIDFFKYCIKIKKSCIFMLPKFIFFFFLYMLKVVNKEKLKSTYFSFIKKFNNLDKVVNKFWEDNDKKIKNFFLNNKSKNDIVISASPEFLLNPVAFKYRFKLIATIVNKKNGKIIGKNCHGFEKVRRLNELKIFSCNNFYTDSLNDLPLVKISKHSFIVKKNNIIPFNEYKECIVKKARRMFFTPDFFTFIFIGVINSINGVLFSYIYSRFIKDSVVAYVIGFCTSLIIAYMLNTIFNFKEKIKLSKFLKFSLNNIPNFIIQVMSVFILIKMLGVSKFISYSVSAVIAVPITFILIKLNVFKDKED